LAQVVRGPGPGTPPARLRPHDLRRFQRAASIPQSSRWSRRPPDGSGPAVPVSIAIRRTLRTGSREGSAGGWTLGRPSLGRGPTILDAGGPLASSSSAPESADDAGGGWRRGAEAATLKPFDTEPPRPLSDRSDGAGGPEIPAGGEDADDAGRWA